MASHVINGLATFAHPLSPRQIAILYLTAAWTLDLLDGDTMSTDDMYWLLSTQYWGR